MVATIIPNRALAICLLTGWGLLIGCAPPGPGAFLKGKSHLAAGRIPQAIEQLQRATTLMPTNAVAWNDLGVAYHQAGQWSNAVTAYSFAVRHDRDLFMTRYNLGCLWLERGNLADARAELFSFTSRCPKEATGWVKLGTAQSRLRDWSAAEQSFRTALELSATDAEAWNGLGLVFGQRKQLREAAACFAAAITNLPAFEPALLNAGTAQWQLGDRPLALNYYRQYLALKPKRTEWEAVHRLVQAAEVVAPVAPSPVAKTDGGPARSAPVKSEVTASEAPAVPAKPGNGNSGIPRSVAAAPTASTNPSTVAAPPPVAAAAVPAPVAPAPQTPSPSTNAEAKRSFFARLNPFSRATKPATNTTPVAKNPLDNRRYPYLRPAVPVPGDRRAAQQQVAEGQVAQKAGNFAEALKYYRRAVELDGTYFEAHFLSGSASHQLRSFGPAAQAWEFALAVRPNSADARYNFALTLKAAGYLRDAVTELDQLITLHPSEARGHLTLGNLYADQLGDKTKARAQYQQVLRLDPRNPQAQAIRDWLAANPG